MGGTGKNFANGWQEKLVSLCRVFYDNLRHRANASLRGHEALEEDPLLRLRGSGRDLWASEHADEYVRRLRQW